MFDRSYLSHCNPLALPDLRPTFPSVPVHDVRDHRREMGSPPGDEAGEGRMGKDDVLLVQRGNDCSEVPKASVNPIFGVGPGSTPRGLGSRRGETREVGTTRKSRNLKGIRTRVEL